MGSCSFPNLVFLNVSNEPSSITSTGKKTRLVKFLGKATAYSDILTRTMSDGIVNKLTGELVPDGCIPLLTPCGVCDSCRANKAGEKAVRAELECLSTAEDRENLFLTFTYDNFSHSKLINRDNCHPAYNGDLNYSHIDYFFHELRKKVDECIFKGDCKPFEWIDDNGCVQRGSGLRYMRVGEYGDKSHRPHFHALVFGIPKSLLIDCRDEGCRGGYQYCSFPLFSSIWTHGKVLCGAASFGSAYYVACYSLKSSCQEDDSIIGRVPAKASYSLRPGLGHTYFHSVLLPKILDNASHGIYEAPDILLKNGKYVPMPEYFFRKLCLTNPEIFDKMKLQKHIASFFDYSELCNCENFDGFDVEMHKNSIVNSSKIHRFL